MAAARDLISDHIKSRPSACYNSLTVPTGDRAAFRPGARQHASFEAGLSPVPGGRLSLHRGPSGVLFLKSHRHGGIGPELENNGSSYFSYGPEIIVAKLAMTCAFVLLYRRPHKKRKKSALS